MKAKIAAVVAVLMLPLLFGFVLVTPAQAAVGTQLPDVTWLKGTIDNKSTTQQWLSEAVDPSGYVHISYYDSSLQVLMYATNAGGSWKTEQIGSTNDGMFSSIAVDRFGTVSLAYLGNDNKLYYTHHSVDGSWSSSTLIGSGGRQVSIAVDVSGVAHVAYQDANDQKLMYADNTGGAWSSPVIVGSVDKGISIGVDNNGNSYISYRESQNSWLKLATNSNGAWVNETVLGGISVSAHTAISMNNVSGSVMIVYYDLTSHVLKSVVGIIGAWSTPLVVQAMAEAPCVSIVMDPSQNMHLAYYYTTSDTLRYANNVGGTWTNYMVDTEVYSTGVCAIDLDSYNKVHIAYMSASCHLSYVTSSGSSWSLSSVETTGDVGFKSVTKMDSNGYTHIVYIDRTDMSNPKLMYVTNTNGGWVDQLVANHASSPSMVLSSNGKVYVSYYNDSSQQLKYATNANGNWVESTVDTGQYGTVNSIVLGQNGTMYIAYRDDASHNLIVAEYANGTRQSINSWDLDGITNSDLEIVLDSNNKVFIVYCTEQGLKMVTNKDGTRISSVIDPRVSSGLSVLINSTNQILVSYYTPSTNQVVYRYYSNSVWSAKDIALSGVDISDSSLILDSYGSPRIAVSLSGISTSSLLVVEKMDGVWMSSNVDTGSIGAFLSMAVDKYDRFHVSYYSVDGKNLQYAVSITVPTTPSNVNGTRGDHFVRLTWAAPTSNGGAEVDRYIIYRGTSSGSETYLMSVSGTSLVYNDTAVENGNTLYYRVVAVNSEGASLSSQEFTINAYSNSNNDGSLLLLLIAGLVGIVVIVVVVILVVRKVKPKNKWKH